MQQQAPQTMNQVHPAAINVVSTEQIQKYLDENKNLIVAILENQNLGKLAECARYQSILQKNLMYLAAIADAQPPGSGMPSQLPNTLAPTQATTPGLQNPTPTAQQQAAAKSQFQLNPLRPQDQQNQLLQFQQQQQLAPHFGLGGVGGSGGSMGFQGSQPGMVEGSSGNNQGNSDFGPVEGRE